MLLRNETLSLLINEEELKNGVILNDRISYVNVSSTLEDRQGVVFQGKLMRVYGMFIVIFLCQVFVVSYFNKMMFICYEWVWQFIVNYCFGR